MGRHQCVHGARMVSHWAAGRQDGRLAGLNSPHDTGHHSTVRSKRTGRNLRLVGLCDAYLAACGCIPDVFVSCLGADCPRAFVWDLPISLSACAVAFAQPTPSPHR
jgi:hypothetical protein